MRRLIPRWIACALPCTLWLCPQGQAATGDWDRSFAQNGLLSFAIPGITFTVRAWESQPDGRIVIAGHTSTGPSSNENSEIIVARFNPDGTLDSSFDGDGHVQFDPGSNLTGGTVGLKRQSDGKLLVVGQSGANFNEARLVRFNVDGSRDMSFGTSGEVTVSYPTSNSILNPFLELAPNGGIYVAGGVDSNTPTPALAAVGVTRLTSSGAVDPTFGSGGTGILRGSDHLFPEQFAVAADGKIIIGGTIGPFNSAIPFVGRMTSAGQTDASFGTNGVLALPFLNGDGYVTDIAAGANGKVVVSGFRHDINNDELPFIARLNDDGTPDAGFGSGGRIIVTGGIVSIFVENDGSIVASGGSNDQVNAALLAHYNSDGSPDVTFGLRGISRTDFATGNVEVLASLMQVRRNSDGSYLALVRMDGVTNPSFALARFRAQGPSAGVLGIRAEYEGPSSNLHMSVYESMPKQKFFVYRTGGTEGAVSVQYRTVADTAIAGQDFVAKTGTVTLNDGETSASFDVDVIDDSIPEINFSEFFHVELFGPTGGAALSKKRATIELFRDDDWGQRMSVYGDGGEYLEGATARVMVYRSGDMSGPMTLTYTITPGTANAGSDYTGTNGTLQWPANEGGSREISVPLLNDSTIESDEQFTITITDPTGVATGLGSATINIVDNDDTAGPSPVAFGSSFALVDEGAAAVTFNVYRLGDSTMALNVPWSTSSCSGQGAAIAGQDYAASNGTLAWAAGESGPKTISIPLINDTNFEGIESCGISANSEYPVGVYHNHIGSFVIKDDDGTPAQPVISIGAVGPVDEGIGTLNVPVTLTGLPPGPYSVLVDWQAEGETASPNDLSAYNGQLAWQPGENSTKYISIPIVNDTRDETNETFSIYLSRPQNGATLGVATTRIVINDNDPTPAGQSAPVPPGVEAVTPSLTVGEGQRTAVIFLRRVGDTTGYLNVSYFPVEGSAASPADFISRAGYLTWNANEITTKVIEVQLNGDAVAEPTEAFTVNASAFNFSQGNSAVTTIPVTIVDDDAPAAPARVGFTNATESVAESATTITVPVGRTGNTAIASSIDYATAMGTGNAADFTASSGTLTWAANDSSNKLVTITLLPDAIDEPDETFTISLSNPSSGTQVDTSSVTVTIQDDDLPPAPPTPPTTPPTTPPPGGNSGGGGGGGAESYLSLLLLAAVLMWRRRSGARGSLSDETPRRIA